MPLADRRSCSGRRRSARSCCPAPCSCAGRACAAASDPWLVAGQGATVGLALQGIAFLAGRALGAPWLTTLVALAAAGAGLALARRALPRRRGRCGPAPGRAGPHARGGLAAVLLQPLASAERLGEAVPFDLLFHAGTAAELRHRWPLEDPRVAGVPLHYHVLAYALPIEAADRAAAPLADPLLALAPLFWVGLLALQLANAGRVVFGDARAGVAGAAVALFHADPGAVLGLGPGGVQQPLRHRPSTEARRRPAASSCSSASRWRSRAGSRRSGGASSPCSPCSPPPRAAPRRRCCPWCWAGSRSAPRGRSRARRAARGGAGRRRPPSWPIAGAPFTLWQSLGPSSYSRMAHARASGPPSRARASRGEAASRLGAGAALGPPRAAPVPALARGLPGPRGGRRPPSGSPSRRERLTAVQAWALALAGTAVVASQLVDAPGLSQLFLRLQRTAPALPVRGRGARARVPAAAARGLRRGPAARARRAAVRRDGSRRALPAIVASDAAGFARAPAPMPDEYARGLGWLRAHASRDAVVFADNPSLLLSAFGEVRLYYETGLYTARAWEVGPEREPWPERAALQERLLRRPDPDAVAEAQARGRSAGPAAGGRRRRPVAHRLGLRARLARPRPRPAALPGGPLRAALRERRAARLRGAPLAERLERRAPVLGLGTRGLETEARERRRGRPVAAQAARERARLHGLARGSARARPTRPPAAARRAASEADGERQARGHERPNGARSTAAVARSSATSATRHASAREAGSAWVRRATDAAAAATNSGSGPLRRSPHAASATPRRAAGASGHASSPARYHGPRAGGTRRLRERLHLQPVQRRRPPTAAVPATGPADPPGARERARPRSARAPGPEPGARPAASAASLAASASAARSVSSGEPEVSISKCANSRFTALGICASIRARAARSSRPSRSRSRGSCSSGAQCTTTRRSKRRWTPALDEERAVGDEHRAAARRRSPRPSAPRRRARAGARCALSRARAEASANTIAARAARSSAPSRVQDPVAEGPRSRASASPPGAVTSRATASRSSVRQPRAASRRSTCDLPHAMPPVRPTRSTPRLRPTSAAARTVFAISIAIVSGPTPPGTGVSAPATSAHLRRVHVAHERVAALLELGEALRRTAARARAPGRSRG